MARKEKSRVKRRRMGCLTGCLARLLTLLGLAALLFVASCVFGIVSNDPAGRPSLSLQDMPLADVGEWVKNAVPKEAPKGLRLPEWAYSLQAEGLTLKMLRAGKGEALLVCSDGYTMLVGGGSGKYGPALQMLLCGVNRLDAAVALSSAAEEISGLSLACQIGHPGYLFYQNTQTANTTYNALLKTAESMQRIVPHPGLSFTLGRAQVTFLGPVYTHHRDERDDGLSLRIDYGGTSFLILGGITAAGEQELIAEKAALDTDVLVCAQGGGEEATCPELIRAVTPEIALCSGAASWQVKARLEKEGAAVYSMQQHGVVTVRSDGLGLTVR
ncbi:MAG: hypothetical protein J6A79_15165 [Clostridia bacterium]|nr:hypothetical protein [Clostridia bacterium]